ncbi:MAG: PorV/PorQ family protein [Cyclobacteriaceae bacterium]
MNKHSFIFIIALLLSINLKAQISAPKYSNEFLSIGVDARALGMGRSVVANVNDVTAAYWNPAGLTGLEEKYEASLMHAVYFAGIANFDYVGFATKTDSLSTLAISAIRFGIDDIPDTRFLYDANGAVNYDNIRFFSAADYAFLFSYARRMPKLNNLKLGASFKVVHRVAGQFANAWGFGLDAGAQYEHKGWQLGLMLRDVTGTFNAWAHNPEMVADVYRQTGNEIPENSLEITLPRAILGIGRYMHLSEKFAMQAELNMEITTDGKRNVLINPGRLSVSPMGGLELNYARTAAFRLGVGEFQQFTNPGGGKQWSYLPAAGIGIKIKSVHIDYALSDIGNQSQSPYSHIFSLKARFKDGQRK